MQRWVASAGFTLLAFACLQLAWCSCQSVIDEYHHLKCKRKRLCEGRHDELPPAGALRETLGDPSLLLSLFLFLLNLSWFLLYCFSCPSLCPFPILCFCFAFFTFLKSWGISYPPFVLLASVLFFLPPWSCLNYLWSISFSFAIGFNFYSPLCILDPYWNKHAIRGTMCWALYITFSTLDHMKCLNSYGP